MSSFSVVEKEKMPKDAIVLIAFPDAGLVGTIAARHFIEEKKPKEIGYVVYDELPPVVGVENGFVKSQIRIYAQGKIVLIVSEVPVPAYIVGEIASGVANWIKNKSKFVLILGGLPHPKRIEIEEPKVYGIVTNEETKSMFEKSKISLLEEGFVIGPNAAILLKCYENGIKAGYVLADSHFGYPDPGAAAAVLKAASKVADFETNIKSLLDRESEIRLMTRSLMKSTEESLKEMQKKEKETIPVMYR